MNRQKRDKNEVVIFVRTRASRQITSFGDQGMGEMSGSWSALFGDQ
jgi:hypothetical protein